ncbi:hypothetical protein KY285_010967 [Solanum tuberosum]|nr:hypothetical protein KY289_011539 [Solanum tuberosum]KAH0735260.1 hypothetical protein KY285_010967 [Solanum tuberosum]
MNYASRFADVNHGPNRMPFPPHPANFHTGLLARQDQTGNVNRGLSREVIFARMNHVMYQSTEISTSDEDTCSICLDGFSDGQIIGSTDCHHTFHFDCINQWLMQDLLETTFLPHKIEEDLLNPDMSYKVSNMQNEGFVVC